MMFIINLKPELLKSLATLITSLLEVLIGKDVAEIGHGFQFSMVSLFPPFLGIIGTFKVQDQKCSYLKTE